MKSLKTICCFSLFFPLLSVILSGVLSISAFQIGENIPTSVGWKSSKHSKRLPSWIKEVTQVNDHQRLQNVTQDDESFERKHYMKKPFLERNSLKTSSNGILSSNLSSTYKSNGVLGDNYYEIEMFVLVDTVLEHAIESRSGLELNDYVHTFVNAMNHMYEESHAKDSTFPTLKIKVVRIDVLKESYEKLIFVPANDEGNVDIQKCLKRFRHYSSKLKMDKYDHTMVLTGRDLYRHNGNFYESDVLGVAFYKGACTKNGEDSKYDAISIVEDPGALCLGIYPAVHEIAHNLGAKHDSKAVGTPYECHAKRGYIMSPVTERSDNMYQFSDCSLKLLKEFMYSKEGKCLAKGDLKPVFPDDKPAKFPGDYYTMDEICSELANHHFPNEISIRAVANRDKSDSYLCKQVSCIVELAGENKKFTLEPPLAPGENTQCGDGNGKCKSGECV